MSELDASNDMERSNKIEILVLTDPNPHTLFIISISLSYVFGVIIWMLNVK